MGICTSMSMEEASNNLKDMKKHRQIEHELAQAKVKMASEVKVLLLGSGDSGKSTVLKQMRLIHGITFTAQEIERYRQLVFDNLTQGMQAVLQSMEDMHLDLSSGNQVFADMIENTPALRDGEPFPVSLYHPLKTLWADPNVQKAWDRGNEAALPENLLYFFSDLDRLFEPHYRPHTQDIVQCRARTISIVEITFQLKDYEMTMVDVSGQRSERRKWIHCFQDVTNILFLVSLSGYDQCLVEDQTMNQMQDAVMIWEEICRSKWFMHTSIILFLNKNDLFQKKIAYSDIKTYFPDYDGEPGDVHAGRQYFRTRFSALARASSSQRELYVHVTTATDTFMLRVVMAAVEE